MSEAGLAVLERAGNAGAAEDVARELAGDPACQTQWWYYHGHLRGGGRDLAFHTAFFRRTAKAFSPRIGVVPVRGIFPEARFAHLGVADLTAGRFHHGHRRALWRGAGEDRDGYRVWLRDWAAWESPEGHRLRAEIRGARIDLLARPVKPPVRHAAAGGGRHLSYTRMAVSGRVRVEEREAEVTGEAWMDYEGGPLRLGRGVEGWDWLGMQLDDGREVMVYLVRDELGRRSGGSRAAVVEPDGRASAMAPGDWEAASTDWAVSPRTGNRYPVGWRVRLREPRAQLRVEAATACCELDTRGSTGMIYWEGPARVAGTLAGRAVAGRGFIELIGYDRAGRAGAYDFRKERVSTLGAIVNEMRLRRAGPGVACGEEGWEKMERRRDCGTTPRSGSEPAASGRGAQEQVMV